MTPDMLRQDLEAFLERLRRDEWNIPVRLEKNGTTATLQLGIVSAEAWARFVADWLQRRYRIELRTDADDPGRAPPC